MVVLWLVFHINRDRPLRDSVEKLRMFHFTCQQSILTDTILRFHHSLSCLPQSIGPSHHFAGSKHKCCGFKILLFNKDFGVWIPLFVHFPTCLGCLMLLHFFPFQHLPTSSNVFQHLPTSSNVFQHLPTSSNVFQHLPTSSNVFQRLPSISSSFSLLLVQNPASDRFPCASPDTSRRPCPASAQHLRPQPPPRWAADPWWSRTPQHWKGPDLPDRTSHGFPCGFDLQMVNVQCLS